MPQSNYKPDQERKGKALCLSGGGFRAALFHLGAMRRLNEVGMLSQMDTISSVSGGSIANGLLARVWPRPGRDYPTGALKLDGAVFKNFETAYEAPLREFCSHDIRTGVLVTQRLDPRNWPLLLGDDHSATDFLAETYRERLVGDLRLSDLRSIRENNGPTFVFDAANMQTGVNFEFSGRRIGDYMIGHGFVPELLVAEAIAASSSFTIAFPPLVLKFAPNVFAGGELERRLASALNLPVLRRRVVLSDGGVYDNLGLEPVWKSHEMVLCSDGGKPFDVDVDPGNSPPFRLIRANSVIMNQVGAVRKRWLVSSLDDRVYRGAYWGIGTEIEGYPQHRDGYSGSALDRLRAVRTDLDAFSEEEQLVLMNHGWLLADAALRSYVFRDSAQSLPKGKVPSEALLDGEAAVAALANSDRIVPLGRG